MKKPLLFCLFTWLVLLVLPWTRGRALLDWRGATVEQFSGDRPEWAPLDAPYLPEKTVFVYGPSGSVVGEEPADMVQVNGLTVATQFASLARRSADRDVLLWCALSATNSQDVARNMAVLERRFPEDAAILAWTCGAQAQDLSMATRVPGPLSSPYPNWSVQVKQVGGYNFKINYESQPKWEAIVAKARLGQRIEPRNGFWWWLEAMALLSARHDEAVWSVLRVGSSKTEYNDYSNDRMMALRRAHIKTQGAVPVTFLVKGSSNSFAFYGRWREVTRQVCENIIGARMAGRHKTALEGGRDMVMMGRLLRRSKEDIAVLVAVAVEAIALRNTLAPSASKLPRLPASASAKVLLGSPNSLIRYASDLNRKDIVLQLTNEMNAIANARRVSTANTKRALTSGMSFAEGVRDGTMSWAAGSQNTGLLLVQTLPVALLVLVVLSAFSLVGRRRVEAFALPTWWRGLGWSAFALVVLFAVQTLFGHLAWQFIMPGASYWGFDFILPRLVDLLPTWAFAFAVGVAGVGALWSTVAAARRASGKASVLMGLRNMLDSPDERMGTMNLGPVLQLIALVGIWGASLAALGAWFYFPQEKALQSQTSETLHAQYGGASLALFCLLAVIPALLFRAREWGLGVYLKGWLQVTRRFLVAHLVLTTALYALLAINSTFWGARFDEEWLKANGPPTASGKP